MVTCTKWYVDAVDDTGRTVIAYWVRLGVADAAFTWHACTLYAPDADALHRWSVRPVAPPAARDGSLVWESRPLGLRAALSGGGPRCERTLYRDVAGTVQWHGELLAADVHVDWAPTGQFTGVGYAECLTLTVPPWQLPIDTLSWGRWVSDDRLQSSVWFRWEGPHPLSLVIENGRDMDAPMIETQTITTAESVLGIAQPRLLVKRRLREIVQPIPLLTPLVPEALLDLEETKWVGRGTRRGARGEVCSGWSVFETVRFR